MCKDKLLDLYARNDIHNVFLIFLCCRIHNDYDFWCFAWIIRYLIWSLSFKIGIWSDFLVFFVTHYNAWHGCQTLSQNSWVYSWSNNVRTSCMLMFFFLSCMMHGVYRFMSSNLHFVKKWSPIKRIGMPHEFDWRVLLIILQHA
jgi:hypothetical protein